MITQRFILHIVPDEIRPRIYLSQRSAGVEKLQFTLVGPDGTYYTIPQGTAVTLVGSKPDKRSFSYACTYSDSTVTCDVTEQMTAVAGLVEAELRFASSTGTLLPSQNIEFVIERSPLDASVCSKNDFKSVDDEIIDMHQDAVNAKKYADQAQEAGEQAVSDIEAATTAATATVSEAVGRAVTEVNDAKETAIDAVEGAAQDTQDAFDEAVARVQELGTSGVLLEYISSTESFKITSIEP